MSSMLFRICYKAARPTEMKMLKQLPRDRENSVKKLFPDGFRVL